MTDDQLFGEVDLEERISELEVEVKSLNAFIVSNDLENQYILWKFFISLEDDNDE